MEHLASVEATNDAGFQRVLDRLVASAGGGALVVMVALASAADLDRLARMRRRFGSLTIVQFDPSSWDPSAPDTGNGSASPGSAVLHITRHASFADTWNQIAGPIRQPTLSWSAPTTAAAQATAEAAADDWDRWARPPHRMPRS